MAKRPRPSASPTTHVGSSAELIGTAAAAGELGVSNATLRRWLKEGRIKGHKIGKQWKFRRSDLATVIRVQDDRPADEAPAVDRQTAREWEGRIDALLLERGLSKRTIAALTSAIESEARPQGESRGSGASRLLAKILINTVRCASSEVHFEPMARCLKIRQRLDGVLMETVELPRELSPLLIREVKHWAQLDLNERRRPQCGRIALPVEGREIDFRVSTVPATNGEAIALRVLDRGALLPIDRLGLDPEQLERYRRIIHRPPGLVLVTGPAGCGKTTTLYATLRELNDASRKIMTAEDPVEYELDGIVQAQINPEIAVGYREMAFSMLQQGADVMLVGEVRDGELAEVLCRAAMTGHLVFAALHSPDAPSALTHLLDLGVDPLLVSSSVQAVLAQRLVRRICGDCKETAKYGADELAQAGLDPEGLAGAALYRGAGCVQCTHTGYRGRIGIFQLLESGPRVHEAVYRRESTQRIRDQAVLGGTQAFVDHGKRKVLEGVTTVEELARLAPR